MSAITVSWT